LTEKLDEKNITYTVCEDKKVMIEKKFLSAPILEVDGKVMTYLEAVNWVKGWI
jgi:hypothetical protein